jgi:wyosine [tRNA(Phe)-imidazoG37] synthetase (radical SAM superfamily)
VSPGATRYVFGPVPSRRLGRSLGVDLVPFKTCTYDCVYCQLGHTTFKTAQRRAWVPVHKVLAEVRAALGSEPEWITLAGSGEPTLHCGLGAVVKGIKQLTSTPVAVLTNGSLFWQPQVRDDLAAADLVMPSLDAPDAALFRRVNRPHHAIGFGRMVDGLGRFRRKFRGLYWLEVFLLDGVTSSDADGIAPDLVQLNTVGRPPAERTAAGVPAQTLERLAGLFSRPVEVIAPLSASPPAQEPRRVGDEEILELVARRPSTVEQIATGLGIGALDALHRVEALVAAGVLERKRHEGSVFVAPAAAGAIGKERDESRHQRTG